MYSIYVRMCIYTVRMLTCYFVNFFYYELTINTPKYFIYAGKRTTVTKKNLA